MEEIKGRGGHMTIPSFLVRLARMVKVRDPHGDRTDEPLRQLREQKLREKTETSPGID